MCIRDRYNKITSPKSMVIYPDFGHEGLPGVNDKIFEFLLGCLLYTSDAADDLLCVDLGGRRIIKKNKQYTD